MTPTPTRLALATGLAKAHKSGSFLFWTQEDWREVQGVQCTRIDSENVRIVVRTIGRGSLVPETTTN